MSDAPYAIIDNFLSEEDWTALWTEFQVTELLPVSRTVGAWKLSDGVPLGGHEIITPERESELVHNPNEPHIYPSHTALDAIITGLLGVAGAHGDRIGDGWKRISARAYVYPRGAGLSWHRDDSALYSGAYIYYAHPQWDAHWGGELLIADDTPEDLPIMAHRFETESFSGAIMESGAGRFVMPKPNRLVILGGAPHAVAPVSPAAGAHVRASVSGFFLR